MRTMVGALAALVAGAVVPVGATGSAWAQGSPAPTAAAPPSHIGTGQSGEPEITPEGRPSTELPVLYITGVEIIRSATDPKVDIVRATGLAATQGWAQPTLVPTYEGEPGDDVVDLELIAIPPVQSQRATGFVPVDAIIPLEPGQQIKGVRVRGAENAITVKDVPGTARAEVQATGCEACAGKKLSTANEAQADSVRQQDLPKDLRVIGPTDGMGDEMENPNRLTLILDESGTIVRAFWE